PGDRICQWSVTAGSRFDAGTVFFQILPPAGGEHELSVQEESVTLTAVEGAPSTPVSLHVTPPTWDPNYDIEVVNSSSGFAGAIHFTRSTDGFDVSADAAALAEGSYYASLRVFSLSPFFSSQVTIPIALTVGPGLVRPADVHRVIDSESVANQLAGTVPISLVGGPAVGWSASSDAPWLTLNVHSGQTGGSLAYDFDNASFRALRNGAEHTANITVTPDNPAITPQTFQVRIEKHLAQVTGLGPYLHLSGRPLRAYVRGLGFSSLGSLSRVSVNGLGGRTLTLMNDTTLVLDVPGAVPAGTYRVSVSNALGIPVASREIKVIDPVSYPYSTAPVGFAVGNVIYDAERQRVYVVASPNEPGQFLRFDRNGAGWTSTQAPAPASSNLGLSNDGTQLLITEPQASFSDPTYVHALDAGNLAPLQTYQYDHRIGVSGYSSRHVAVTSDGRVWLGPDRYANNRDVSFFDTVTGEF